jgi:CheY-like chemotaxis protein
VEIRGYRDLATGLTLRRFFGLAAERNRNGDSAVAKTVLIVEDDSDTREIYQTALTERGYDALVATDGAEGVHVARKHHPDLILLDIRMPVMDGWQAVCYLRSFPQTQKIPICGISAYAAECERWTS